MTNKAKIKVFLSYSHKDEYMKEKLDDHLAALKRMGLIETWHDRIINAGDAFDEEIMKNIQSSDIFLPLLSSNFLSSDYCYVTELTYASELEKEGKLTVIPVVLKALIWHALPISKKQAVPKNAKAINKWRPVDDGYKDAVEGILKTIEKILGINLSQPVTPPAAAPYGSLISNLQNHPRNPSFTGRADYFTDIQKSLSTNNATAITQPAAIHGLGGVGKTQLALEYAWRNCGQYDVVWWLRSETTATLDTDLQNLGVALGLPLEEITDRRVIIPETLNRLSSARERILLIFDNVENREAIKEYHPHPAPGATPAHIIITSRSTSWLGITNLPLNIMKEPEAVEFLTKNTSEQTNIESAKTLARELGCLPLALSQARAYIDKTACGIDHYLKRYKEHKTELFKDYTPDDYDKTVHTTWDISFNEVTKKSPTAACLMNICSFLAPDDIPLDIFEKYAKLLPEPLRAAAENQIQLDKAIAALLDYCLIERKPDQTISIHRLVQEISRIRLDAEKPQYAAHAASLMSKAFVYSKDDLKTWPDAKRLAPHAVAAAQNAHDNGVSSNETGYLFNQTSLYFHNFADFQQAKSLAENTVKVFINVHGENHPNVAISHNTLGLVLKDIGNLQAAKDNFEKALKIGIDAYGEDHPTIASRLNNLGLVLKELGNLQAAKDVFKKALKIDIATYGDNHPAIASSLNNLGGVLHDLGDLHAAKDNLGKALIMAIASYGKIHPNVALCHNNLGGVLQDLGDLHAAKKHSEKALKIVRAFFDEDHPTTKIYCKNLEILLKKMGTPPDGGKSI